MIKLKHILNEETVNKKDLIKVGKVKPYQKHDNDLFYDKRLKQFVIWGMYVSKFHTIPKSSVEKKWHTWDLTKNGEIIKKNLNKFVKK